MTGFAGRLRKKRPLSVSPDHDILDFLEIMLPGCFRKLAFCAEIEQDPKGLSAFSRVVQKRLLVSLAPAPGCHYSAGLNQAVRFSHVTFLRIFSLPQFSDAVNEVFEQDMRRTPLKKCCLSVVEP